MKSKKLQSRRVSVRAARVTLLLMVEQRPFSTGEIQDLMGYRQRVAAENLMNHISAGSVPIYQPDDDVWAILE